MLPSTASPPSLTSCNLDPWQHIHQLCTVGPPCEASSLISTISRSRMAYSLQGMHVPSCCEFLWAQLTILTAPRIGSTRDCNCLVLNYPWQGLLSSSPLPLMPMKLHKTLSNELVICYVFYVKLMSFGNKPWIYMLPLITSLLWPARDNIIYHNTKVELTTLYHVLNDVYSILHIKWLLGRSFC
jgi:hypothetical protein